MIHDYLELYEKFCSLYLHELVGVSDDYVHLNNKAWDKLVEEHNITEIYTAQNNSEYTEERFSFNGVDFVTLRYL